LPRSHRSLPPQTVAPYSWLIILLRKHPLTLRQNDQIPFSTRRNRIG
jgi:hypothetical protein